MTFNWPVGWSLLILSMSHPTLAWAQAADPVRSARIRFGPLGITPALTVTSGVDTNVFNEDDEPKSDVTTAVNPRAQVWFRMRRLVLDVRNSTDVVSFKQYSGQGGLSTRNDVRLELPVNRVRFSLTNSFASTQQRASLEIDTRGRRRANTLAAEADVRATAKTTLRLTAGRSTTAFDDEASFLGVSLAKALNQRVESATASLRYQPTGVTTLILEAETTRDKFEFSSERDSTSFRVAPGVEFAPRALISGRAYVGYRRFTITSGLAPEFTGPVALVELASTIRVATRVSVQVNRDVAYSFDVTTPYYVTVGGGGSITQRIAENWDVTATAARQRLNYRTNTTTVLPATADQGPGRSDSVDTYTGAVSYHLNRSMSLGMTVGHMRRTSGLARRNYEGTRVLGQFTYGS